MERLALMGPWDQVGVEDLSFISNPKVENDFATEARPVLAYDCFELPPDRLDIEALNRKIIKKALEKNQGNKTRTAQYLGISRRVLQGKLKKMLLKEKSTM
jgi:DNA-binding NtrC family response regulator